MDFFKNKVFSSVVGLAALIFISACGAAQSNPSNHSTAPLNTSPETRDQHGRPENDSTDTSASSPSQKGGRHAPGTEVIIEHMSQFAARRACPSGTYLPTIRELAFIGKAQGAKGILEIDEVTPDSIPSGFHKISATDSSGQTDEFYYNSEGYKPIHGLLGTERFWSSSVRLELFNQAYFFSGVSGDIGTAGVDGASIFRSWCFTND